jgi:starch synthase
MPPVRALQLASRVAPLAGGEDGESVAALCRALASAGERVTVVTRRPPGASDADLARAGMARRLDPLELTGAHGGATLTVHEGRLAGGAVPVFAIEGPEADDDEVLAGAALDLAWRHDLWPDLVRAWDDAPHICAQVEERAAPPGCAPPSSVLLLRDAQRHTTPALRDALAAADRVALPSHSYAEEMLTSGEGELVDLLRAAPDKVRGVPSGIDESRWIAAHDPGARAELRRALRRELGLGSGAAPLVCVLGPIDLLDRDAGEALAHAGAQLVFAHAPDTTPGSGQVAHDLAHDHPMRVRSLVADAELLQRIVAAADIALFCHHFAPGGFSPLYCMTAGTVPVAPRSGAFADTLTDWDAVTGTGTGFLYPAHRPEELPAALRRAMRAIRNADAWRTLVARVAATDVSWRTAGLRHAELAREALRAAHG